jgi:hypothetical protein
MNKYRVTSDGLMNHTVHNEQGEDISNFVQKVVITIEVGKLPTLELTLIKPEIEAEILSEKVSVIEATTLADESRNFIKRTLNE